MYICKCGKEFEKRQSYYGHCSKCKVYLGHEPYRYRFSDEDRELAHQSRVDSNYLERRKRIESILETGENNYVGGYSRFRDELIEFGYKEWRCEKCNNTMWNGSKIPLEVHHIDGYSNKLDNIQLLCPNCHAQTDNYRWKVPNSKKIRD